MVVFCQEGSSYCDSKVFMFFPGLAFQDYLLRITILNEDLYQLILDNIHFSIFTHTNRYITFLLLLRYSSLIMSVIGLFYYLSFYSKTPKGLLTFEHDFILILSIALVLFNDPFNGITLVFPNVFFTFISTLFVSGFVSLLVFFWFVMFERIYKEPLSLNTDIIGPANLIPCCILFLILLASGLTATILTRFDPGMHIYEE
jgi:hypothetical protein